MPGVEAAKFSNIKRYAKGAVLVRERDESRELYLVLQGSVGGYKNYGLAGETQEIVLSQGNFCGEMPLFLRREPSYTLVALTDAIVLVVNRRNLGEFLALQTDTAVNVIEHICHRLEEAEAYIEKHQLAGAAQSASGQSALFPQGHGSYTLELANSNEDLLFTQAVTCPLCGQVFDQLTVLSSRLRPLHTDNDLRTRYQDIEPLHYEIVTCPGCLFSASVEQFPQVSKRLAGAVNKALGPYKLGVDVKTGMVRDTFTVFVGYYLAMRCAEVCFDDQQLVTGGLWQKLSRLYADCGDENMSLFAAGKALEDYKYAYEHFNIKEKQMPQLCYVIGCLLIRQGDDDQAREYFYRVKTNPAATPTLKRHAENRADEIRERKNASKV